MVGTWTYVQVQSEGFDDGLSANKQHILRIISRFLKGTTGRMDSLLTD